jgi:mutator protein MutT
MKDTTLLFLVQKDTDGKVIDICLAMKKRGFGASRYNGVGGKLSEGESVEEALVRECNEEICVIPKDFYKVAELSFSFPHNPDWNQLVHTYFCTDWNGDIQETEEMKPEWFSVESIPFDTMWPDDVFWLPKVIEHKKVKASFVFGEKDIILSQNVEIVESF